MTAQPNALLLLDPSLDCPFWQLGLPLFADKQTITARCKDLLYKSQANQDGEPALCKVRYAYLRDAQDRALAMYDSPEVTHARACAKGYSRTEVDKRIVHAERMRKAYEKVFMEDRRAGYNREINMETEARRMSRNEKLQCKDCKRREACRKSLVDVDLGAEKIGGAKLVLHDRSTLTETDTADAASQHVTPVAEASMQTVETVPPPRKRRKPSAPEDRQQMRVQVREFVRAYAQVKAGAFVACSDFLEGFRRAQGLEEVVDVKLFYEDLKAEIERAFAGTDVTNAVRNRSRGYRGLLLAEHEDD